MQTSYSVQMIGVEASETQHSSARDIWLCAYMRDLRDKLVKGDRSHSPCSECSVNGELFGKESAELYYRSIS